MVRGRFDLDNDDNPEITIGGGILAALCILIVADFVVTGGQVTLGIVGDRAGIIDVGRVRDAPGNWGSEPIRQRSSLR